MALCTGSTLEQQTGNRLVHGAALLGLRLRLRFEPARYGAGMVAVAMLRLAAAPADRITGDTLDRAGDALMVAGGIGYAGVAVRCRDGRAGHPDGSDGRALVGAVREVGGDRRRIRR